LLKLDLHVHTSHSYDGRCSVEEVVAAIKARGLDGAAITDHNSIAGHEEAKKFSNDGFLLMPGIEVSSRDGHIVGLGVSKLVPRDLSAAETVERIREQGGIAIAAHPFVPGRSPRLVYKAKFDAIEVLNSRAFLLSNPLARRFAERNKVPMVGGSDAHRRDEMGLAYTCIDCEPKIESVLEQIRKGKSSASGRAIPFPNLVWRFITKIVSGK
jgi:predicted metal-dependent phosphoesterase TrpH